jgi:hypothetical protein
VPTVPAGGGVTEMLVGGPLSGRCSERRAEDSEGTESHGLPVSTGLPPMTVRGRSISARQVPKAVGLAWLTSSMGIGAMTSAVWIAARGRVAGPISMHDGRCHLPGALERAHIGRTQGVITRVRLAHLNMIGACAYRW